MMAKRRNSVIAWASARYQSWSFGSSRALAIVAFGVLLLLVVTGLRLQLIREARSYFQQGFFARTAYALEPWFRLGLLDIEEEKLLLSSLLRTQAEPGLALAVGEECLIRHPGDLDCALDFEAVLVQQHRLEEAEQMLISILANHPNLWQAHFRLAEVAEGLSQSELALAEYQAALGMVKSDEAKAPVLLSFLKMLNRNKRFHDSERFGGEAQRAGERTHSIELLLQVAEAENALGRTSEFIQVMRSIENMANGDQSGYVHRVNHQRLFDQYRELSGSSQPRATQLRAQKSIGSPPAP